LHTVVTGLELDRDNTYLTSWGLVQLFLWNYFSPSLHIQWTLVTLPVIINTVLFMVSFSYKSNEHYWKSTTLQRVKYEAFPPWTSIPRDDYSITGWTHFLTNHLQSTCFPTLWPSLSITELLVFNSLAGENGVFYYSSTK